MWRIIPHTPVPVLAIAVLLLCSAARGAEDYFQNLSRNPDAVRVVTDCGVSVLTKDRAGEWQGDRRIRVLTQTRDDALPVKLSAPAAAVEEVQLLWQVKSAPGWKYLGDAWERAYGDLEWRTPDPERIMPWYFLASDGTVTHGYGVKTGASALCYWTTGPGSVTLHADVRCGGAGVQLGPRTLDVCTVVCRRGRAGEGTFAAAQAFCRLLCPHPRIPSQPVYGFNDWYCTYGHDTASGFLDNVAKLVALAPATNNRPFAVVDDGWELTAGDMNPWSGVNTNFSRTITMPELAAAVRALGARPGLWFRPLLANESQPASWRLSRDPHYLDPTVPEVRAYVRQNIRRFHAWGFELLKHDFSTYDLFGRWGFQMGARPTTNGWAFADHSRTSAEIIRQFYQDIRDAAGDGMVVEGCDTIGHLSAGIFDLQRIGDDTSGREWDRTRKMGVNSLAFRGPQQGAFFVADADCVGQEKPDSIPWAKNSEWLELLAHSGTAFFASFDFNALDPARQRAVSRAFAAAARPQPVAVPLDWMAGRTPSDWRLDGREVRFNW